MKDPLLKQRKVIMIYEQYFEKVPKKNNSSNHNRIRNFHQQVSLE